MNYNVEREHDRCLISLVKELDIAGRLDIFKNSFRIDKDLGPLTWAGCRRAFDVELKFANLSVAVETKVHSDESGRWSETWQTKRIAEERRRVGGLCFYITYGTSEFYTKCYKTGPASPEFQHVSLERMMHLVESSLATVPKIRQRPDIVEWFQLMTIEKEKRDKAQELLRSFSVFRARYLEVLGENDFPRGRVAFSAPELAFPVFSKFAKEWGESDYVGRFGKLSIYPVPRGYSPVVDSVLNFSELWERSKAGTGPGLGLNIVGRDRHLYLEINEDFNLNLKLDGGKAALEEGKRAEICKRLGVANWPPGVNARPRNYRQQIWVLYEVDFGFLSNIDCLPNAVSDLGRTLEVLFYSLNGGRESPAGVFDLKTSDSLEWRGKPCGK